MANDKLAAGSRLDEATGTQTVGHEWDGIEELDTPMPRWWLWAFYATIVWGIAYVIAYPAWPMIDRATEGVLGWSSRGQLATEIAEQDKARAATVAALADMPIEKLPDNPALMRAAVAGGRAAFKVNCVQCHGAGAAGSIGYPNLNDDDWLWGGNLKEIEYTIIHGTRQPGGKDTHTSLMPAFGRDQMLTDGQISAVADHVLSLSGRANRMRPARRSSPTIARHATAPTARAIASSARPTSPTPSGSMADRRRRSCNRSATRGSA